MRARPCVLPVLLLFASRSAARSDDATRVGPPAGGAFECPCISNSTGGALAAASAALVAKGYPPDYGFQGCQAYDAGLALEGCDVLSPPEYCSRAWCYVDAERCPENAQKCIAEGGEVGSRTSPYCREREHERSVVLGQTGAADMLYSYATCGNVDYYGPAHFQKKIGRRQVILSVPDDEYPPWLVRGAVEKGLSHWQGNTGVLPSLVEAFAVDLDLNLTLRDHFASAQSRAQYPGSSFTACVLDVRAGKVDLCVGNFWVTAERLALVHFVQPFSEDRLYLVASSDFVAEGFWDYVYRPFKPFENFLWLCIWAYMCFATVIGMAVDWQSEDYENACLVPRFCKSTYLTWHGLFSGGPQNSATSFSARLSQLGVGFFIMVLIASYTANLATILVGQSQGFRINSIEDAVAERLTICVLSALLPEIQAKYPRAQLAGFDLDHRIFRELNKGMCGAAIMSEEAMLDGFSGRSNAWDCAEQDAAKLSSFAAIGSDGSALFTATAESACERDEYKKVSQTRDCGKFSQVGSIIASVDLAIPASDKYAAAMSYFIRNAKTVGEYDKILQRFADTTPV